MKINRHLELAIKAIEVLKTHKFMRGWDLAVEIGTTEEFLQQIMRKLRKAKLVKSLRGPGGGYILRPFNLYITAWDVNMALGRNKDEINWSDTSSTNKLKLAIISAYTNTVI